MLDQFLNYHFFEIGSNVKTGDDVAIKLVSRCLIRIPAI